MKKYIILCLLVLIAAVSISSVCSIDVNNQIVDGLNSTSDISQGLDDAQINNKSLFLIFDQESCYYCDLLKEDVLSDSDVQKQLNENYNVVFVDINEEYDLSANYHVMGTPTCVVIDSNGHEIARIDGYMSSDEFLDELKEI